MGRIRMKRPNLSRLARARIGMASGAALIASGLWLWFSLGVALTFSGALLIAYWLLVADIAPPGEDDGRPRPW